MRAYKISPDAILIDGLTLYESILLYFGILVLMMLIIGIFVLVVKGKKVPRSFIAFFAGAVIMIAFPGIEEITYNNLTLKLKEKNEQILTGSADEKTRNELENVVARLETKMVRKPEHLTEIAKAKTLLGDYNNGLRYASKALDEDPGYKPAREVISLAQGSEAIETLIKNPGDMSAQDKVTKSIDDFKNVSFKGNYMDLKVAEAYLLTGNTYEAKRNAERVISHKPNNAKAQEIIKYADVSEKLKKAINEGNEREIGNITETMPDNSGSNIKRLNYNKAVFSGAVKASDRQINSRFIQDSVQPKLQIERSNFTH